MHQTSAKKALNAALVRAETIFEGLNGPKAFLTKDLAIVHANAAFYSTFDFLPQEVLGKNIYTVCGGCFGLPDIQNLLSGEVYTPPCTATFILSGKNDGQFSVRVTRLQENKDEPFLLALFFSRNNETCRQTVAITDLFSETELQRMQDLFSEATGVASLVTLPDGSPLTRPSKVCRLCCDIIRNTEKGRNDCSASDAELCRQSLAGPVTRHCPQAGLLTGCVALSAGGQHIGSWIIGQARDEGFDPARVLAYAREIGADETACRQALANVPVMSAERFRRITDFLAQTAAALTQKAYQNFTQTKLIAQRVEMEETLRENNRLQALVLNNSVIGIALIKNRTLQWVNPRLAEQFEMTSSEMTGLPIQTLYRSAETYERMKEAYSVLGRGGQYETEVTMYKKNGAPILARIEGRALQPEQPMEGSSLPTKIVCGQSIFTYFKP